MGSLNRRSQGHHQQLALGNVSSQQAAVPLRDCHDHLIPPEKIDLYALNQQAQNRQSQTSALLGTVSLLLDEKPVDVLGTK